MSNTIKEEYTKGERIIEQRISAKQIFDAQNKVRQAIKKATK